MFIFVKKNVFAFLLLQSFFLLAQPNCQLTISGVVLDTDTHEPLLYTNIVVVELNKVAIANDNGQYTINNLCPGTYTLTCSHLGCETVSQILHLTQNTTFNFNLPHATNVLHEVVIKSERTNAPISQVRNELNKRQLDEVKGKSLGEALANINGVSTLQTGQTIVKPVINGLHSQRILIMNNGVRQEGQQWGTEHAPEIDPFTAGKLTVIKGANAVQYGSDAIGGVILVEPKTLPSEPSVGAELNAITASNGRGGTLAGMVEGKFKRLTAFAWRLQGSVQRSGNLKTPNYYLKNTGTEQYNFSTTLAYHQNNFNANLFYSQYNAKVGIFAGAHIGNLTDLQTAFNSPTPLVSANFDYAINRPRQAINHQLLRLKTSYNTAKLGDISLSVARQFNTRLEYDSHRPYNDSLANANKAELRFYITTYTADAVWQHPHKKNFSGSVGISSVYQQNQFGGRFFIPEFNAFTNGIFAIEHWHHKKWHLEAGLRYDHRHMQVFLPEKENVYPKNPQYTYQTMSATTGVIYQPKTNLQLNANFGTAWRAPHVSELFSNGVHHGSASFEVGDATMIPEKAYNTIAGLTYNTKNQKLLLQTNIYCNLINNFIYLQPQNTTILTIRGAFPVFAYKQTNALLTGIDWQMSYQLTQTLKINHKGSYLYAYDRTQHQFLVMIPPTRLETGAEYQLHDTKHFTDNYVSVSVQTVFEQKNVPPNSDFVPPPPAYTLLNAQIGTNFAIKKQHIKIGLSGNNLLNTTYRDYLDRFRYFADAIGTNVSLRITVPIGALNVP